MKHPVAPPPVPLRCLLVEDRPVDAELIKQTLRQGGYAPEFQCVETEADYLSALQSAPDIVLSDYTLPGFSGLAALARLRESARDIPFILVSGTIGEEIAVEAMRLGATDYVLKDRLTRLGPAVRRALGEARLRAERHLAEDNYRTLFEQAGDGIFISDTEGRLLDANLHGCELFGCTRRTVLGSLITDHIIPAERPQALAHLQQSPFVTRTDRHQFRRCDGSLFTGEASLKILPDGRLLSIVRDITARETADRRIREQADLLNQTHDCIVVTGLDGVITFWNHGAERTSGWLASEVVGRRLADVLGPNAHPLIQTARTTLESSDAWQHEARLTGKSGQPLLLDLRVTQLRDDGGQLTGRLCIAKDISEKRKLEEQFLRSQRMENLGLLAAGIAHDMNNILAPMMMIAPLLRSRLSNQADHRLLDTLEQSARRGAGLVKQILAFAHGTGSEHGPIQVKHVARDIVAMIEETFPRNLQFSRDIPADLWPVRANPTQIHQVLLNLCVNARDAMPAGGELRLRLANCTLDPAAVATIPEGRPGRFLLIEVADTGTGIPPELRERIWEPFFTTKGEGKGSGLGLSTVRGIISRHQGFGTCESTVGRGTTFRFFLPAEPAESGPGGHSTSPFTHPIQGNGETLLIVDDEKSVCDLAFAILTRFGYRPLVARDGEEALRVFSAHRDQIRLVVTDHHMPGLHGMQLIAALRKLEPDLPTLLCTGLHEANPPGTPATDVLLKPFEATALLAAVQSKLTSMNGTITLREAK